MDCDEALTLLGVDAHADARTIRRAYLDDAGELLVGEAALARALTHPYLSATNFKRDMGTDARDRLGGLSSCVTSS